MRVITTSKEQDIFIRILNLASGGHSLIEKEFDGKAKSLRVGHPPRTHR
jgi:hypothetical protein